MFFVVLSFFFYLIQITDYKNINEIFFFICPEAAPKTKKKKMSTKTFQHACTALIGPDHSERNATHALTLTHTHKSIVPTLRDETKEKQK